MLKLNEYQNTKKGEYVFPFAVHGDTVQCFNLQGDTIYKRLDDFDDNPEETVKEKKIVEVSPVENQNTDELYNEDEEKTDDGLREEEDTTDDTDDSSSTDDTDDSSSTDDTTYVDDDNYI